MAIEWAPHHLNVNCIAPGFILTELAKKALTESEIQARQERIPLGRYGKPEDGAGTAVFLASADSDYITGTTILGDGGFPCAGII
jgi:gluconate 5-dehydrogenase/2-deoxy-D-gluconate 3-dehydrogenase